MNKLDLVILNNLEVKLDLIYNGLVGWFILEIYCYGFVGYIINVRCWLILRGECVDLVVED